jgi:hypothetical protein
MINKVKYILNLFKRLYHPDADFDIHYGINNQSKIQIKKGNLSSFENKSLPDLNNVIWKDWQGEKIPFFFDREDSELITFKDGFAVINFDIIASAFFLLCGWQEYVIAERDQYGRFRYADSIQKKLEITFKPVVNYYFDILKFAINKIYKTDLEIKLWDDKDFAVVVSHDIDECESAWKQASFWQLKQGNIIAPFRLIAQKLFSHDAWFNFSDIIDIEKNLGINSTFHFITYSGTDRKFDNGDYNISDKKFATVFTDIQDAGSELALHGSNDSHINVAQLNRQKEILSGEITGNRFHYLNFDINATPQVLQESDFNYDATIGFAESAGFRASFCLPYYLYDLKNDKPTSVLEIPLMFMDSSLRLKDYMDMPKENIFNLAKAMITEIKKHRGIFSINWHNNRLSDVKDPGWKDIFIKIIKYCRDKNALFLTGKEIVNTF